MRWRTNPLEGWYTGFAWVPLQLSTGDTIWLEPFRFFVNRHGLIPTIIATPLEN